VLKRRREDEKKKIKGEDVVKIWQWLNGDFLSIQSKVFSAS
jgi:hypothetical protein